MTVILRLSCRRASTLNKNREAVPHSFVPLPICVERHCNQKRGCLGMEPLPPFSGALEENGGTGSAGEKAAYCFLQLFITAASNK